MATHLAAVPHRDPEQACNVILKNFPEAPGIPRLTRSTRMYLEGIPCLEIDRENKRLWFDITPQREGEVIDFYERCSTEDMDYFAISRKWAPGMYMMLERLKKELPSQLRVIHIQTPGPVTWGLTVTDENKVPAFYNETMRDILVKTLAMKAKWQELLIKEMLPGVQTMVDYAEPALLVHTSAGGSGDRELIIASLNEVLDAVEGFTCIHCCANIDWSILMDTNTDAINFDAYEYADKIALYPEDLKRFLGRGGMLAWGIVPTIDDKLMGESVASLAEKLEETLQSLINKGIDEQTLLASSIVTPSCSTASLSLELSDKAFELTREVSQHMREKYGFN